MIDFPFAGAGPWVDHFKEVELPVLRHTVHQLEELRSEALESLSCFGARATRLTQLADFICHRQF